jgi:hypothetical protein
VWLLFADGLHPDTVSELRVLDAGLSPLTGIK